MPIPLRPLEDIVKKWSSRAAAASGDYTAGVSAPLRDWQTAAKAASEAWKTAVTQAAGRDAYRVGVEKTTTEFWKNRAVNLGAARFTDGVSKSTDVYKNKWAQYYEALSKIDLPARGARGDPNNIQRVKTIMDTLRRVKTGGK